MSENQQIFHDTAVLNQRELEGMSIDLDAQITQRLVLESNIEQFVPKLKQHQRRVVQKGKEFRNQRQVMFYQPTDYYQFEAPVPPADSEDGEVKDDEKESQVSVDVKDPLVL